MRTLTLIILCSLLIGIHYSASGADGVATLLTKVNRAMEIEVSITNDTSEDYGLVGIQKIVTDIKYPIGNPTKWIHKETIITEYNDNGEVFAFGAVIKEYTKVYKNTNTRWIWNLIPGPNLPLYGNSNYPLCEEWAQYLGPYSNYDAKISTPSVKDANYKITVYITRVDDSGIPQPDNIIAKIVKDFNLATNL